MRARRRRYFLDLASRDGKLHGYLPDVVSHASTPQSERYISAMLAAESEMPRAMKRSTPVYACLYMCTRNSGVNPNPLTSRSSGACPWLRGETPDYKDCEYENGDDDNNAGSRRASQLRLKTRDLSRETRRGRPSTTTRLPRRSAARRGGEEGIYRWYSAEERKWVERKRRQACPRATIVISQAIS